MPTCPDNIQDQLDRMDALIEVGRALMSILEPREPLEPTKIVLYAFVRKTARILGAIRCLLMEGFDLESQVLVRVLVELDIDSAIFIRMASEDPTKAFARVLDALMLDKLKALRGTNFTIGDRQIGKVWWEGIESEMKARHSEEEFQNLKRYGFSGMTLEERARQTGHEQMYNLIYRMYSRNTHFGDLHEQIPAILSPGNAQQFEETAVPALLGAACSSAAALIARIDEYLGKPVSGRLTVEG